MKYASKKIVVFPQFKMSLRLTKCKVTCGVLKAEITIIVMLTNPL
jgi:hypothetical protein